MIPPGTKVMIINMNEWENGAKGIVLPKRPRNGDDYLIKITDAHNAPEPFSYFRKGAKISYNGANLKVV